MKFLNHRAVPSTYIAAIIIVSFGVIFFIAQAQPVPDLQAQTNALSLPPTYSFTRDLTVGSKGEDVRVLQQFLNSQGAHVSFSGPGSIGNETMYFGPATRSALARWQMVNNISPSVGYFGPKSRLAFAMAQYGAGPQPQQTIASALSDSRTPPLNQGNVDIPVRIVIPKMGTNAPIELVGLTAEGAMDIPKAPNSTAWFSQGPRPGEVGSAVIAGHFGWRDGIPAVFDNLHTLQKGDRLYVEDGSGKIRTFVVRELRTYGEYENASDVFASYDGGSHLNLVTCQGVWNKTLRSYSKRLVVFTDRVE